MGDVFTEYLDISGAQYLYFSYSQFVTLCNLILNDPHMSIDPSKSSSDAHSDGVIGSLNIHFSTQSIGPTSDSSSTPYMT